jgi:hypothetical protein
VRLPPPTPPGDRVLIVLFAIIALIAIGEVAAALGVGGWVR